MQEEKENYCCRAAGGQVNPEAPAPGDVVDEDAAEKRANDGVMAGANVWPSDCPGFRESVLTY